MPDAKYPLPSRLEGVCSVVKYHKLLRCKADELQKRDKRIGRVFDREFSQADYKMKIHAAMMACDGTDPYTGDALRFDLMGEWNNNTQLGPWPREAALGAIREEFYLLPVVDHVDPDSGKLEFEICSWIVNEGKSQMAPEEYRALCGKVVAHGRCGENKVHRKGAKDAKKRDSPQRAQRAQRNRKG